MTPVESYLSDLHAVRGAGTAETSGYPALANLFNSVGDALKPKIRAVIHPANSGAGLPDGGFFSAKELKKHPDEVSLFQLKPERGVLEVKPVDADMGARARGRRLTFLHHGARGGRRRSAGERCHDQRFESFLGRVGGWHRPQLSGSRHGTTLRLWCGRF